MSDLVRVHALLGPTNTGKTHRAIERMLDFESGMMGFPLRLLAREVYDKLSARLGEHAVALVTGEEKRIPAQPRYWICTVEAMPLTLVVDFLAIDEIQLVGHPERGHVFTDRLLHARGRVETWFLGADTVQHLLREHVADLRVQRLPRLSQLAHAGRHSLRTLPRRSAVVAFSLPAVYEIADLLRVRRGGAAVVLGALSPRVRNAQVALYQAGEVDFLVATDAIGMGLNLDIDHVALAGRVKFDGFEVRDLEPAEIGQIVGRAGRHLRDGTFGTLGDEAEFSPALVKMLESHRFAAQRFFYYRNADLDFSTVDTLLASLTRRPNASHLRLTPEGDDLQVLRVLSKKSEVQALADSPQRLRLLWEVCRIPNYEKRLAEHQAEQMLPLFVELAKQGALSRASMNERLHKLARYEGDIHQLMDRLAAVRTWTYVSHHHDWVQDAEEFRERSRETEDKLSDVLHERLLARFVAAQTVRRPVRSRSDQDGLRPSHRPFEKLAQLSMYEDPERTEQAQQRAWIERVVAAQHRDFELSPRAEIVFEGERVARLTQGTSLLHPAVKRLLPDWVTPGMQQRIERRLLAFGKDLSAELFAPLLSLEAENSAPLRGLIYQLQQGLGCVDKRKVRDLLNALTPAQQLLIEQADISIGRHSVFVRATLTPRGLTVRRALAYAYLGRESRVDTLAIESALIETPGGLEAEQLAWLGFMAIGALSLRYDVAEELTSEIGARKTTPGFDAAAFVKEALVIAPAQAVPIVRRLLGGRRRRRRAK
jgi:ATP-dependent RNA helicase SUPV3L1/SUV3